MIAAIAVALASAFFFAFAATLQQREAALEEGVGESDPRLLWRLAHRPLWLAGIGADLLAAALQVFALSLGSVAVVQPVGITGLLFAIPMVAVVRRTPVAVREIGLALVVLAGLALFLSLLPPDAGASAGSGERLGWVIGGAAVLLVVVTAVGHGRSARIRAVLLAAGAGMGFGVVAVLVRAVLVAGQVHATVGIFVVAAVGIVVLAVGGYQLLQHAYRAGHFAASLATAVVVDPAAAILAGALALDEPLPQGVLRWTLVAVSAVVVTVGVTALVRSPADVLTLSGTEPPAAVSEPR